MASTHSPLAATGEYGDMLKVGILDPTKVTRSALQNAASVSGRMTITEAMVAELPKDEVLNPRGYKGMRTRNQDGLPLQNGSHNLPTGEQK